MAASYLILIALAVLLVGALTAFAILFSNGSSGNNFNQLSRVGRYSSHNEDEQADAELEEEEQEDQFQRIKKTQKARKGDPTVEEQLIMAGRYSREDRADFQQKRLLAPFVFAVIGLILGVFSSDPTMLYAGCLVGVILGIYLPIRLLRGWVQRQHDEISFYLPLVIEQISIGVSSSLDIGPCLSQIVQMADERRSHNAVTELLKYAQFQVKSGVGLEEALNEVGVTSGQTELKHALLALSQVAKFGGEISRQLQDLADAVASSREAKIEAKLRTLELKATAPVGLVFLGYLIILAAGIGASVVGMN